MTITRDSVIKLLKETIIPAWAHIVDRKERAVRICNTLADHLRAIEPGWGVLGGKSPGQNGWNYAGHRLAVDIVCNQATRRMFDCLADAGNRDEPAWNEVHLSDHMDWSNWRPVFRALLEGVVAPPAGGPTTPPPDDTGLLYVIQSLKESLHAQTEALLAANEQTAALERKVDEQTKLLIEIRSTGVPFHTAPLPIFGAVRGTIGGPKE